MKVLIDECAPKELKTFFAKHGHKSLTVQEAGWAGKQNGELLKLAETDFDVLVTVDTNLSYQQTLEGRRIAVVSDVAVCQAFGHDAGTDHGCYQKPCSNKFRNYTPR